MTNVGPNSGRGGMPKWLIILLVVFLVIILGCCGGIGTCIYLGGRVASRAAPRIQAELEAAQQRALEAQRRAEAAGGNVAPAPAGDNGDAPVNGAVPAAPTTPDAPAAPTATPAARAQKLPATFPKDVPIEPGLTPTFTLGDNAKGNGSVVLSGNIKADDAVAYYTKELEKNGWTQTGNTAVNTTTQLQYKKDPLTMIVQITGGEGSDATTVMISYEKQQ